MKKSQDPRTPGDASSEPAEDASSMPVPRKRGMYFSSIFILYFIFDIKNVLLKLGRPKKKLKLSKKPVVEDKAICVVQNVEISVEQNEEISDLQNEEISVVQNGEISVVQNGEISVVQNEETSVVQHDEISVVNNEDSVVQDKEVSAVEDKDVQACANITLKIIPRSMVNYYEILCKNWSWISIRIKFLF